MNPLERYLNYSSGIINPLERYLNPSSAVDRKSPCVKFQIEKSDFSNPSCENEIPPVVFSVIEILLRISLSRGFSEFNENRNFVGDYFLKFWSFINLSLGLVMSHTAFGPDRYSFDPNRQAK